MYTDRQEVTFSYMIKLHLLDNEDIYQYYYFFHFIVILSKKEKL